MNDREFGDLLHSLGLSWRGYRKVRKGVKRRVARHMAELGCGSMNDYLLALERDTGLREQAERVLSVSISRFFRDRALWQALDERVLPMLARGGGGGIKAWSAGCARGEEVYSLRILWERLWERNGERHGERGVPGLTLHIRGTDLNPSYLAAAREGVYGESSLKEAPAAWRARYFNRRGPGGPYAVAGVLRHGVSWRVHNLISEPPGEGFQLIFLRNNLLTYYEAQRRERGLKLVLGALAPGGFLVVGAHETGHLAYPETPGLLPSPHHPCLWRKGEGF